MALSVAQKVILLGIINSNNRMMDTYEKSIYKEIINNLKHIREYDIQIN